MSIGNTRQATGNKRVKRRHDTVKVESLVVGGNERSILKERVGV